MGIGSRSLGRRAIAAVVSLGLVTTVTTVAPATFVAPAVAQPNQNGVGEGTLKLDKSEVLPGSTITVKGEGFAPRTEGQGLAVEVIQKTDDGKKVRIDLGETTDGTSFDEMVDRDGAHYGVITSEAKLPNATNGGNFAFQMKLPANLKAGSKFMIAIKGGKLGQDAAPVVKMVPFKTSKVTAFYGSAEYPNILSTTVGTTVVATFTGVPVGTEITGIGISEDGTKLTENWKPSGTFVADDKGEVVVSGISIPASAPVGKSIYAEFTYPNGETTLVPGRRYGLNPNVAELNTSMIKVLAEVETPQGVGGLYQSVYSAKHDKVYLTRTDRGAETSDLYEVDPNTLAMTSIHSVTGGNAEGMFGVAYDPSTDTLWTSNTKGASATVYKTDGTKVATLPIEDVTGGEDGPHPRDIAIDAAAKKAYVGDVGNTGLIYVYNTEGIADNTVPEDVISLDDFGGEGPMELIIHEKTKTLWAVAFNSKLLAKVDLANDNAVSYYDLGNADQENGNRGGGIAIDTKRGNVYAVSQSPAHTKVFSMDQEKIVATIVTGGAPVDALYEPVNDVIYTVNREGGTINVVDPETFQILATKKIGPQPNQLSTDGKGNVFVTTKPFHGRKKVNSGFNADKFYKITFDKNAGAPKPDPTVGSAPGASSNNTFQSSTNQDVQGQGGSSKSSQSAGGGMIGLLALIGALFAGFFYAQQNGMLNNLIPGGLTFPGLPK